VKQVVQSVRSGDLRVLDVPRPSAGPTEVLVRTSRSVLSPGTERAVRALATSNLLAKARARPDLVKQVVRRAKADGVMTTMRAVRTRLDEDMPLGYAAAGTVVEVGEAVSGLVVGQRVATGGAGHAEFQTVSGHLAVAVPEGVSDEDAAFATVASVALHGLRLAELGPGSKICVIGLGLLGQLTVRLAVAAGYAVAGIDLRDWTVARASEAGAFATVDSGTETTDAILDWSRGRGVDAVLVTAATESSEPVRRAPALCRDRAPIVVVGAVGLELDRRPLYEKELSLRVARSYGPGRYERSYEEWGVDFPLGHVRWTEGRNLEAFLDLLASGRLTASDLVTHRFAIEDAATAYALLDDAGQRYLGVQLVYDQSLPDTSSVVIVNPRRGRGRGGIGLVGAGRFARSTLVPACKAAGFDRLAVVASASGLSARLLADRAGFERAVSSASMVIDDPDVDVVVIATPHELHGRLVGEALRAGKHVFCEKPLALTMEELEAVTEAWGAGAGQLAVGFNRRHSPFLDELRSRLDASRGPLLVNYRVNADRLPPDHWYHDRRQGGRLIGEVCHFVDTCNAVVASPVASVFAAASGPGESLLADNLAVTIRYRDGSLATICYASGHPSTPKERLEVLGRGHSAVIDDFRRLVFDEQEVRRGAQDKGHVAQMRTFRTKVTSGRIERALTEAAFETTRVMFAAAESIRTGQAVDPLTL
jgi:predicted dehydrogenase/threonine dehydrogenase-like Zn-dependent dehydrogenase